MNGSSDLIQRPSMMPMPYSARVITFQPRELNGPLNPALQHAIEMQKRIGMATAQFSSEIEDPEIQSEMKNFFDYLISDLENVRGYCSQLRANRKLEQRYNRNDRRAANKVKLSFKRDGDVDRKAMDGNAFLGLTQGWSAQAIVAGAGYQTNMYHERSERFFAYRPVGKKRENRRLGQGLTYMTEYYLRNAEFERTSRKRFFNNFKHGTSVMRFRMASELKIETAPDGSMTEMRVEPIPRFELWPIRDFESSNPERGDAREQEGIFWITRQTNLGELEKNEATWDYINDSYGNPIGLKRIAGEFFNLGAIRGTRQTTANRTDSGGDLRSDITSRQTNKVTNYPPFDLIAYEGSISYDSCEKFTPRLSRILGIDVGMGYGWDETDPELLKEFRIRMQRQKVWQVSYISPYNARLPVNTNHPVQFNIAPFGVNSAYIYRYGDDENELHGLSVSDYGEPLEIFGDALRNAQVRVELFNSDPSAVADKSALRDTTIAEFRKLLQPSGIIEKLPNRSVKEFFEFLYLTPNMNAENTIQSLRQMFFDCVGVLPVIMGNAAANTLGQDRMNAATASNRLDDNLLWNAKEDYRLIRNMVSQLWKTLGRDRFFAKMRQIAGQAAIGLEEAIVEGEEIWDQFYLDHPNSFGRDQTVLSRLIDEKSAIYMQTGLLEMREVIPLSFSTAGYPYAEDLLVDNAEVLDVKEEVRQMAIGNEILPSSTMNPIQLADHFSTHMSILQRIESGMPIQMGDLVIPPENYPMLSQGLIKYLEKASNLIELMNAQQMMAGGGAAGGSNAPMAQGGEGMGQRAAGFEGGRGKGSPNEQDITKSITESAGRSPVQGSLPFIPGTVNS